MADDEERRPADQLVDLLIYAPIGLLYEYDQVLATLVRRGKSQVKLARLLGQVAAGRSQTGIEGAVEEVTSAVGSLVARAITEVGEAVGLAPPPADQPTTVVEVIPVEPGVTVDDREPDDDDAAPTSDMAAPTAPIGEGGPMPIAGYDDLTARQVIPLLEELSAAQRQRVRVHEAAGRNRKTILSKLDRLED